ncbi:MAG: hypothetical protein COV91_04290 [Candidatus Taylorbacteria bacterium CG11_big_fil_rev_8_21_14_0_20_46_11]|uniref:Uncharacterized protein n=1 Tax=Candidatus Taylorbacteria bacterium CG11_big_fil_rev_8_21_14_0_20_46_11 TaxID=1975025 RepID=A0A2H0KAX1_9BACT|nr:MAG: hypothetical protein COV91_04290 [Candidatus Taylorbacteria bacterium CG11_big_fil_rev_8_21_14_0_20_46_11]
MKTTNSAEAKAFLEAVRQLEPVFEMGERLAELIERSEQPQVIFLHTKDGFVHPNLIVEDDKSRVVRQKDVVVAVRLQCRARGSDNFPQTFFWSVTLTTEGIVDESLRRLLGEKGAFPERIIESFVIKRIIKSCVIK